MIMWIWNKIVVVVVDNVIETRWCICWEWYENGMLIDVENALACASFVCSWGGALTLSDGPFVGD